MISMARDERLEVQVGALVLSKNFASMIAVKIFMNSDG